MLQKSTWSLVIILAIFILPTSLFTQDESSPRNMYRNMDRLLSIRQYEEALPIIEQLLQEDPDNANYNFKMAYAIIRGPSQKDPLPYLEKAIQNISDRYRSRPNQLSAPVDALWFIGRYHFYQYNYGVAFEYLQQYLKHINEFHANYALTLETIEVCRTAPDLMKHPVHITMRDFSEAVTLPQYVHSPLFSPDESIFIFTADANPEDNHYRIAHEAYNDDIFYIYKKDGEWSKPKPLSANINSNKKEASVGMHPNGKMLLVYREDNGVGNLYYSDLIDSNVWSPLKKFPEPINTEHNESHATISADGRVMYFTSDRPGGYGGLDIYMSRLSRDGVWGTAINLGPQVNSRFHEESPHLQANSNLIYFSSNRPGGMGGFDVYRGEILQDSIVTNVQNIGYPINTPFDDLFFKTTLDGGRAYYSTACTSTNGEFDLQIIDLKDTRLFPNVIVEGLVIHETDDTLRNKKLYVFNLTTKRITDSTITDSKSGLFQANLHSKNTYLLSVTYDGFVYYSKPFEISEYFADYTFQNTITLHPFYISDSTVRQNTGDFVIFRNNMMAREDDPIFDSVLNIFAVSNSLEAQRVSRLQTTIDTEAETRHMARRIERTTRIEEPEEPLFVENDLIPDVRQAQDEGEYITSVTQIVEVTEARSQRPRVQKPVVEAQRGSSNADSLLSSGISNLQFGQFDASTEDLLAAKKLYDSLQDAQKLVVCLDYLSANARNTGNIHSALDYQLQSLSIIEQSMSAQALAERQVEVGKLYEELWYKDEALALFEKSLAIQKEQNNKEAASDAYFNIADVYMQHNQQEQAIAYLQQSLESATNLKRQAETFNKIGVSYHQLQQFITAIEYYNKAINTASSIDDKEGLALYQNNLGNAYVDIRKFEEALIHYSISLGLYRDILNDNGIASVYYNIGNVRRRQNRTNQAIENFTRSIEIAKKTNNRGVLARNYRALSDVYKTIGNHALALSYYKQFVAIESPRGRTLLQLSEVLLKHTVDSDEILLLRAQMQRGAELYRLEQAKYETELLLLAQRQRLYEITRLSLLGIAIAIGIVLFLFLMRFRTGRKYYKQLSLKNAEILQKQEEITVQRENLEILNAQLERLSIVASQTANTVAILTPNADIEWNNAAFTAQYGNSTANFIAFAESVQEKAYIQECIESKKSVQYETQRNNIWVQCMLTPICIDNELAKIIVIEANITALKKHEIEIKQQRDEILVQAQEIEKQRDIALDQRNQIEEQKNSIETSLVELQHTQKKLIESEKMASLGSLVAGISHEINTPVGIGIAASTSLVSRTESLKELFESRKMKQSDLQNYILSTQEAATLIQSNLTRTGELVKSFKRVSVDEMTDQKREFNLQEYISEVLTSLAAETAGRDIEYTIDCPDDIQLNSYPAAFAKIISNMMKNVLVHAYSKDEKHLVSITARVIDATLRLQFTDKGKGMSPEVVQKVFNPFFTTNMQAGKGLGMNMVYNAVTNQLKGEISCESTQGEGTTYHIIIPMPEE